MIWEIQAHSIFVAAESKPLPLPAGCRRQLTVEIVYQALTPAFSVDERAAGVRDRDRDRARARNPEPDPPVKDLV